MTAQNVLDRVASQYPEFSPQLKRAARYVMENTADIGINSMRQLASDAEVHPNTLVRLARAVGFDGYDSMRTPFRESLREGGDSFPDRARWLQSIAQGQSHGSLLAEMASSMLENVETLFADLDTQALKQVADLIVDSRATYILGVGSVHSMAHNFWYVTRMALDNLYQIPRIGSQPSDDLIHADASDVLLTMTFSPYRSDVVEATRLASRLGVKVVAITDRLSSPIVQDADHVFCTSNTTPQFFPSHLAVLALLETLTAFIVADARPDVVAKIEQFHQRRYDSGVYIADTA